MYFLERDWSLPWKPPGTPVRCQLAWVRPRASFLASCRGGQGRSRAREVLVAERVAPQRPRVSPLCRRLLQT
eukprot:11221604-Lingulodinium_polyedra.AAC.1